jgi:lycopene cyclase domain-containing protein
LTLNQKYLYLWIILFSFVIPLLFSFYPKANFSKKWKFVLPALAINAVIFVSWDLLYTHLGVWGFDSRYTLDVNLLGLPLEEILFFIAIPYACLFTYFALNQLIERDHLFPHQELISSLLIVLFLVLGAYHMHKLYTGITFLAAGLFLALVMLKLRGRFMGRFYFAFAVLIIPVLLVNGALTGSFTGEPVVWYDDSESLGIRIATIPVEYPVYAMLMLLIPITIWEKLEEAR